MFVPIDEETDLFSDIAGHFISTGRERWRVDTMLSNEENSTKDLVDESIQTRKKQILRTRIQMEMISSTAKH